MTREDLHKVSPVAAMLHNVSQSRHEKVPKEPKRGRLSTRKPLSARPKVRKEVCTRVRPKNIVWRADKPILITQNRFSVLSADEVSYKNLFFDDTIHIMYKMISSIQTIFKLDQSVQSLILMLVHVP